MNSRKQKKKESKESTIIDSSTTWLKHTCLRKDFIGIVNSSEKDTVSMTLYDKTVKEVDIIINKEMLEIGVATGSFPYKSE